MRLRTTTAFLAGALLALSACADDAGGGGGSVPQADVGGGDSGGGFVFDTGAGGLDGSGPGGSDGAVDAVDAGGPGADASGADAAADAAPADVGGDGGTISDTGLDGGTAGDTATADVPGGEDASPDVALPTDLPAGAPCGPALGTCAEGATCVETGAGKATCLADLGSGDPCGPGKGACGVGLACLTVGGADVCATPQPAGAPCDGETLVCNGGLSCEAVGAIEGWHLAATWTPDPALSPAFAPGRVARGAGGHAWVIDEAAGRVVVLDPFGGTVGVVGEGTFGPVKALVAPTGLAPAPSNQAMMVGDASQRFLIGTLPGGAVSYFMGGPGPGLSQFSANLDDVACIDGGKWVWASVPTQDKVKVYQYTGTFAADLGESGAADGQLTAPSALWADADGVWVADATGRLQRFGTDFAWQQTIALPAGQGGPLVPADLFVDEQGWIYVADPAGGVLVLDDAGATVATIPAEDAPAPTGVAPWWDGSVLVGDAAAGAVLVFEPDRSTVCVAPAALGAPCGAGVGPCIPGATCVPSAPGAGSGTCRYFAGSGEDCGVPFVECAADLGCVAPDSPALPSVCLPVVGLGEPCGPAVAACEPDMGCAWETPDHLARVCLPRAPIGAACNVYGVGGCIAGASCEESGPATYTWVCKALGGSQELCGPGVGSCGPGLGCNFSDPSLKEKLCYPDLKKGNECGIPQSGLCSDGTSCVWKTAAEDLAVCAADVGPGATCAVPGVGGCTAGSTCLYTDALQTKALCQPDETPVGQVCGVNGLPLCAPGGDCLIDAPGSAGAHCYEQKPLDAPCGAGVGLCGAGGDCFLDDVEALLGACVPARPYGSACGEGIGLCADGGVCVCSDPFTDVCPGSVCIPPVEAGDLCVVNSVLTPIGWVGVCPVGFGCVANDLGLYAGGSTTNDVHSIFFRCMPEVEQGGPCGPYAGACPAGLQCLVDGQPMTLQTLLDGVPGVCSP